MADGIIMKIRLPKKLHVMILFKDYPPVQGPIMRELEPVLKKIAYVHNLGFKEIIKGTQRSVQHMGRRERTVYQTEAEFTGRDEEWMLGYVSWSIWTGEFEEFYTVAKQGKETTYK